MIYLHTGVPGAGKTLFTLYLVEAMARKEGRQVYYSGIKQCSVPGWIEFGAASAEGGQEHMTDASDWMSLPAGSIIVIDEAQRLYRPRHAGSAVPAYVSALETHRHRGLDLFLITQHPGLVDANVRKLVGMHRHVQRTFGMARATLLEWQNKTCAEPTSQAARAEATKVPLRYPQHVFGWYKSAELHTHKRRIPTRLKIALLVLLAIPLGIWFTANKLSKLAEPKKPASGQVVSGGPVQAAKEALGLTYAAARVPEIQGLPMTAPAYKDLMKPTVAPKPVACVASATRCSCYTQQGTKISTMPKMTCESIVENGYFDDAPDKTPRGEYFAKQSRNGDLVAAAAPPSMVGADGYGPNDPRGSAIAVGSPNGAWLADPAVRQTVTAGGRNKSNGGASGGSAR